MLNSELEKKKTEALRRRLLNYPGVTPESVEDLLIAYEERASVKEHLMKNRGMRNAMAEAFLDRQGYPRPPGWHSVFFYPGSNRPRNGWVFILLIAWAVIVVFI